MLAHSTPTRYSLLYYQTTTMQQHKFRQKILFSFLLVFGIFSVVLSFLVPFIWEQMELAAIRPPMYRNAIAVITTGEPRYQTTTFYTSDSPSQVEEFYEKILGEQGQEYDNNGAKSLRISHSRVIERSTHFGTYMNVTITIMVKEDKTAVEIQESYVDERLVPGLTR